jgi:hypothetical protein
MIISLIHLYFHISIKYFKNLILYYDIFFKLNYYINIFILNFLNNFNFFSNEN